MTKNEILDYLAKIDWDDDLKDRLEYIISKYVVYQEDPDTHVCYCHEYYISKEDAEKDFNSRDYVPNGLWCYCIISSINDGADWFDEKTYFKKKTIEISDALFY